MAPDVLPAGPPATVRMSADAAEAPMTAGRAGKSQAAFRTISEVADELDVAQHVLRFWESKFPQVRPLKRGGGRRYYRPEDIDLLRDIRTLLYDEGYTIKGAQKLLRQRRARPPAAPAGKAAPAAAARTSTPAEGPLQHWLEAATDPPAAAEPPSVVAPPPDRPAIAATPEEAIAAPTAEDDVERLRHLRHALDVIRGDLAALLADDPG